MSERDEGEVPEPPTMPGEVARVLDYGSWLALDANGGQFLWGTARGWQPYGTGRPWAKPLADARERIAALEAHLDPDTRDGIMVSRAFFDAHVAAVAERDEARRERDTAEAQCRTEQAAVRRERRAAETLAEALAEYGVHQTQCAVRHTAHGYQSAPDDINCDCGLRAALRASEEEK